MRNSVLITGVGKGLGLEILKESLNKNFFVFGVVRNKKDYQNLLKETKNQDCKLFYGDIKDQKLLNNIFKTSKKLKRNINCLVNNAGERQRKDFIKISKKDLLNIFTNNFFNHFFLIQIFLKNLPNKYKNASIVNIGSIVGVQGFAQLCGYASTKSALDGLTKSLAIEFKKRKIRFNIIHPGFVKTSYYEKFKKNNSRLYKWTLKKIPLNRWGESNEISKMVCFLLSEDASYLTGQSINIDGGWTA